MRVDHMFLVAVAKNGERRPIVGLRPVDGEPVLDAAKRCNPGCAVVMDARPWALLAGDEESADKWIQTNRMPPERMVRVRTVDDVPANPLAYQVAAVGHWIRRAPLRDAMLRLLMVSSLSNSFKFRCEP